MREPSRRRCCQGEQPLAAFGVAVAHLDAGVAKAAVIGFRVSQGNDRGQVAAAPFVAAAAEDVAEGDEGLHAAGGAAGGPDADPGARGAAVADLAGDDLAVAGLGFLAFRIDQHHIGDLPGRRQVVDPDLDLAGFGRCRGTHHRRVAGAGAGAENGQQANSA